MTMLSWSTMVGNVTAGGTDMVTGYGQTMLTWSCPGAVFTPLMAALLPRNVCGRLELWSLWFFFNQEFCL